MATKTHLTAQEESVAESGVQMRNTEPSSPVDGQVWVRTDHRRIKAKIGSDIVVLSKGNTASLEVTGLTVDCSLTELFWKNIAENTILTLENILDGYGIDILVYNTSGSQVELSISNQTKWANGTTGLIPANSKVMFKMLRVLNDIVITPTPFPA